jgi:chromosome partitioning protein
MKIITLGTLKGGVGKTMLCFNIAGILSQQGKKVLIIDSDLQGNLTNNVGLDRTKTGLLTAYDIYNVTSKQVPAQDLIVKHPNHRLPNLDMIAGSIFMHRAELTMSSVSGREFILKNYIEDNRSIFRRYDYILIDTNPSMSMINQSAFLASDAILLVSDISMNAIEGAQLFIALWEETRHRLRLPDNIKGFIVNDFDIRNRLSSDFIDYLNISPDLADIRSILLKTVIPRTIRITESELAAMPINLYDARSKGCRAINALIQEMFSRGIL